MSIGIEAIRSLEIREMEEEEKYLQCLKAQREKVESLQKESLRKDEQILSLQANIKELLEKQASLEALKEQEIRTFKKKQVEEYEKALHDLQALIMQEREEKTKEISKLSKAIAEQSEEIFKFKQNEEKFKEVINNLQYEKDYAFKQSENASLELLSCKEEYSSTNNRLKSKIDSLELMCEDKSREYEGNILKLQGQLSSLNDELNRAVGLISRQEATIVEIRYRVQEDSSLISSLKEKLTQSEMKQREIDGQYQKTCEKLRETQDKLRKAEEMNACVQRELNEQIEKFQIESIQRKEIAQQRSKMSQEWHEEVTKLNDVLASLPK